MGAGCSNSCVANLWPKEIQRVMAGRRKYSRSEKAFYILSLLIVASMVIGLFAVALNPG